MAGKSLLQQYKGLDTGAQMGVNGALAAGVGVLGNAISGGKTSAAGNIANGLGDAVSAIPGPIGMFGGMALKGVGAAINTLAGASVNEEEVARVDSDIAALKKVKSADDFDSLSANASNLAAVSIDKDALGSEGVLSNTVTNLYNKKMKEANAAYEYAQSNQTNNNDNLVSDQFSKLASTNVGAFGGQLDTQGSSFPIGLNYIDTGGSHESNPYDGVQIGVDQQGTPNLVEEGETIWNDYVFSKRLIVPKDLREKYKLKEDTSFADASKKLSKELEERPNDVISKRTNDVIMEELMQSQELLRQKKQERALKRQLSKMTPEEQQLMSAQMQGNPDMGLMPQEGIPQDTMMQGIPNDMPQEANINATGGPLGNMFGIGGVPRFDNDGNVHPLLEQDATEYIRRQALNDFNVRSRIADAGMPDILIGDTKPKGDGIDVPLYDNALRYMPVVGSAIGLAQGLLSKPDYTHADSLDEIANEASSYDKVEFNPIGDYLTYKPMDTQYALNQLNANSAATRRSIRNNSGLNRGAATAGILAADYNAGNNIGNLFRQAEESNQAQRERVATFNRGTNQYNSEGLMKAAMANQSAAMQASGRSAELRSKAVAMRDAIDARRDASIAANFSNIFDNLGNIGIDKINRLWTGWLAKSGVLDGIKGIKSANGGRIKRKKGLTY